MKQITFQIDNAGKVHAFPVDISGNDLPEDQKFNAIELQSVQSCLFNIRHNPQLYGLTAKDFKSEEAKQEEENSFNKIMNISGPTVKDRTPIPGSGVGAVIGGNVSHSLEEKIVIPVEGGGAIELDRHD